MAHRIEPHLERQPIIIAKAAKTRRLAVLQGPLRSWRLENLAAVVWAVLGLIVLAACGSASGPSGAAPTATLIADTTALSTVGTTATAAPALAATQPAPAAATQLSAPTTGAPAIEQGVTAEGYHTLGRADAPVTLIMYSDFL